MTAPMFEQLDYLYVPSRDVAADPAVITAHAADLEEFETTKGAIRFTPDKPIPDELITKLVRARTAETDERWG